MKHPKYRNVNHGVVHITLELSPFFLVPDCEPDVNHHLVHKKLKESSFGYLFEPLMAVPALFLSTWVVTNLPLTTKQVPFYYEELTLNRNVCFGVNGRFVTT